MAAVKLLPAAVEDLSRLDAFLRSKSAPSADRLSLALEHALVQLARFPKLGRLLPDHEPFRELPVPFGARGYVVRYRLEPRGDVVVVRVWHAREERR